MLVVFRKSDGAVISTSQFAGMKSDGRAMLEEVVRGLVGSPSLADFDVFETKEPEAVLGQFRLGQRPQLAVRIKGDGTQEVVDQAPEPAVLQVTTDASELHPVDNVPLIPADGSSFLLVTLQMTSEQGMALAAEREGEKEVQEVIWLRTDHGTLREDSEDPEGIRSITLQGGTARFRLYSGTERRLATVQMLSTNPALQAGGLQVEFI